jgi:DNA-binding SARP family transcriptional activator
MSASLRIEVLGPLQVQRDGAPAALPPSKKTRALLGYLTLDPRPHRRERLCELLWPGPDDPRGALRWSLSRMRSILGDAGGVVLETDRDSVRIRTDRVEVDLGVVRAGLGGRPGTASVESLQAAAAAWRGEVLEGLDLPDCFAFHTWLVAVREEVRGLRVAVLEALLASSPGVPGDMLRYARALVAVDPLNGAGHVAVIRLLGALGRAREALAHYESCRRLFAAELGARPPDAVEEVRRTLGVVPGPPVAVAGAAVAAPAARPAGSRPPEIPFVGRTSERRRCAERIEAARRGEPGPVLLVAGEPGIGKTRMLRELADTTEAAGGRVLAGRAFEAESGIPYGTWPAALTTLHADQSEEVRAPAGVAATSPAGDRQRLFATVVHRLAELSATRPLLVVLDDVQWCDEASAALLHYVARAFAGPCRVVLACGVRPGELPDNPDAQRVLRALARERRLEHLELGPLSAVDAAALAHAVDPALDAARLAREARGNPLFVLEGARALSGGGNLTHTLEGLLAEQLARIEGAAAALLPWAAALGHGLTGDLLGRAAGLSPSELLDGLGVLERRGVLQAAGSRYEFGHDLIRQAAYDQLSSPRRAAIHGHLARTLSAMEGAFGPLAAELARHASLGGDHGLAARACLAAAERCLRLFAPGEAFEMAGLGLEHARRLEGARRVRLEIGLLKLRVLGAPPGRRRSGLEGELQAAIDEAGRLGLQAEASAGLSALSILHQEEGDFARAKEDSLRAAEAGRTADPATSAGQLANTARCLAQIERDVPRARLLAAEAETLAARVGVDLPELSWALGLLRRWDGRSAEAAPLLERAAARFRRDEDRRRECMCLATLAALDLEEGRTDAALQRCAALRPLAERLHEAGDEGPLAAALGALSGFAAGEGTADHMDIALARLAALDSKAHLAHALNLAAELRLSRGEHVDATSLAEQALAAATGVQRRSEMALARATLAGAALRDGDTERAAAWIRPALPDLSEVDALSARAREALRAAAAAAGLDDPTLAHTDRR